MEQGRNIDNIRYQIKVQPTTAKHYTVVLRHTSRTPDVVKSDDESQHENKHRIQVSCLEMGILGPGAMFSERSDEGDIDLLCVRHPVRYICWLLLMTWQTPEHMPASDISMR